MSFSFSARLTLLVTVSCGILEALDEISSKYSVSKEALEALNRHLLVTLKIVHPDDKIKLPGVFFRLITDSFQDKHLWQL